MALPDLVSVAIRNCLAFMQPCRYYAGYPITPSSEIMERIAVRLKEVDGVFMQMEDEIAAMGAVIGASLTGYKAMTATSGPGFSLKQENIQEIK